MLHGDWSHGAGSSWVLTPDPVPRVIGRSDLKEFNAIAVWNLRKSCTTLKMIQIDDGRIALFYKMQGKIRTKEKFEGNSRSK
jgi:hypothetical protein